MRQNGPGVGLFIALALVGSAGAVALAAWLGHWGGWNPTYDTVSHDGARVTEVDASLFAAEERWTGTLDGWVESGAAVDTSADAECYLQVWPGGEMADVGLCGPFVRSEGHDPEWASFEWSYDTLADGTVRILPREIRPGMDPAFFPEPSSHDEIGASGQALFYVDSDLLGADGRVADRPRALMPPMGWPRTIDAWEPGDELLSMPRKEIAASRVVRLYGHDYRVEVDSVAELRFSGERTYVPAPGGGIVDFRITPAEPDDRAAQKALARATGLAAGVASPDRDATIRITCEVRSGGTTSTGLYAESVPQLRGIVSSLPEVSPPSAVMVVPQFEEASYAVIVDGTRHPVS